MQMPVGEGATAPLNLDVDEVKAEYEKMIPTTLTWASEVACEAGSYEGAVVKTKRVDFAVTCFEGGRLMVILTEMGKVGTWIEASVDGVNVEDQHIFSSSTGLSGSMALVGNVGFELDDDDVVTGAAPAASAPAIRAARDDYTFETTVLFGHGPLKDVHQLYARRLIEIVHKKNASFTSLILGIAIKESSPVFFRNCINEVECRIE